MGVDLPRQPRQEEVWAKAILVARNFVGFRETEAGEYVLAVSSQHVPGASQVTLVLDDGSSAVVHFVLPHDRLYADAQYHIYGVP